MLLEVVVGAVAALVVLSAILFFALRRAPLLFVADKLPGNLMSGADEVDELVTGSDGVDEAGPDRGQPNEYE